MTNCRNSSSPEGLHVAGFRQTSETLTVPQINIVSFTFAHLYKLGPDKPIYFDARNPSKFLTASMMRTMVGRLAKGLENLGLKPGQCVSIHSFNNIAYPVLWLGVIAARGCVSGSNPAYTVVELVHHFNVTSPKYVIAHESCLDPIIKAASICHILPEILVFNDDCFSATVAHGQADASFESCGSQNSKLRPLTSIWTLDEIDWNSLDEHNDLQNQIAVYATTSGTTGLPKAALISHKSLVSQGLSLESHFVGRTDRVSQLICLPVFHAFAAPLALILPLRLGIPTYFLPRFKLGEYVQSIARYSITDSAIVPKIASSLLNLGRLDRASLRSLRYLICAGAPMNFEVQAKLYEDLSSNLIIAQCWGATELGWATLFGPGEKDNTGSVGHLLPNTELKIVEPNTPSILMREGEIGEACVRSTSLFSGYRNNEVANASAFDGEGFYRTGDRASFREGKLYLHGRLADTMKVNGWQVSPEEIEHILNQHPMISDSAVVGITQKDASGLEETFPRAYVVPRYHHGVSEEEIQEFVSSRVIAYKRLSGGIVFVSRIPRNPTGKILRRHLRT